MSFVGRCYSLEEVTGSSGEDDDRNVHHIILLLQSGRAGRRCYYLEEVTGSSVEDDNRNVHHIILMLRSGRAGRRCHLLGDLVPLKKHRAGMETMAEEMFIISFCCNHFRELLEKTNRNVQHIRRKAGRRCHLLGDVIPLKK
ncbi:hypothetical protein CEXT_12681 [Caerostris extrusa]|uniref:Uncharacterized protein n=1 Tax=Caerostris extrusa TaxID=172846 RepID=A0AAV4VXV4_CAEEX|nr:hypothetical protein CEXT_12681 [Caerostris extrusa]